jgi:2-polyprenyl-6-methoxyphenol hydroxylase-like FAD-dependent oxidoreductase
VRLTVTISHTPGDHLIKIDEAIIEKFDNVQCAKSARDLRLGDPSHERVVETADRDDASVDNILGRQDLLGSSPMPNLSPKHAIVIGAGLGGLAAAKAVAAHFERVTVFDRDALPEAPAQRSGTPQARHTHALLAGGHRALERLFPGIEHDLIEAGAVRMRVRSDMRFELPGFDPYPQRDFGFDQFCLSRPLLERICRRRIERESNIEVRPRTRVTELTAAPDNRGAAGVRFENVRGKPEILAADLVVDASGRASLTLPFLETIGASKPATIEIGMDQAYSTAVFEKPEDAPKGWLGVLHLPTPPGSSRFGIILPMEGCRWIVSLGENHGKAPPGDIDGFMDFAKSFRMPTIYRAIRNARRIGEMARYNMSCSVRRAFNKLDWSPKGLIPIGDSVCRFTPIFGQGMSVAAQECCVLESLLEARSWRSDPLDGLAESFLREIQPLLETPWANAIGDLVYPQTRGDRPPDFENAFLYMRALTRLAAEDPETDRIVSEVRALLRPQSALREPELANRVMALMTAAA